MSPEGVLVYLQNVLGALDNIAAWMAETNRGGISSHHSIARAELQNLRDEWQQQVNDRRQQQR